MGKNIILKKIGKGFMNIVLFPFWLAIKAIKGAFYILGLATGFSIVRTALTICLAVVALVSILWGNWDAILILGIPLLFVYLMPYIAGYITAICDLGTDKISDYWHTPAGYSY